MSGQLYDPAALSPGIVTRCALCIVMCGCVCVGFVMCGCFDNCVGVLVICVFVFTVFCIVSFMYIYSYLLLM